MYAQKSQNLQKDKLSHKLMKYWLIKSEPSEFSITDLRKVKKTAWTGVRNYQARNFMRDAMQIGDIILFYHSNANPSGIVGVAKVASKPYADPTQFDTSSEYFDAKATAEKPIWMLVDVAFVQEFAEIISLEQIKDNPAFTDMVLIQKGSRLSVQPVSQTQFEKIVALSNKHLKP